MGYLSWMILGFIAGMLAKWLTPGKTGGGFIITTLLGVAGAFVGGLLGSLFDLGTGDSIDLVSVALATLGAFILLAAYNRFT
ncbi:GlsB/YeaQ/YmgE family stress response membrane protein [Amphritea balenae]|uniref:GlsB/YeaQ/YmgE family stress response membrane protein n=1 Tax=Amphritea balenae TaxID=452629 RepID=A0A3P1SQI1_9GAMM|nr:GlsB/YeaQ/YmgE family stress response membrane protein [Amphritea balenae]RRC99309.1 GlsB/YeaQ/YmgE family stress response membrane protein [Amphritea balenae]GGK72130.1 membrane protein [Amphritea balenae]